METLGALTLILGLAGVVLAILLPFAILGTYFQVQKLVAEQKQTNKCLAIMIKLMNE